MKNNLSFVIQIKKNNHFTAIAISVSKSSNLYHYFDSFNIDGAEVIVVHYVDSWTKAIRLEQEWNASFQKNGTNWTKEDYAD